MDAKKPGDGDIIAKAVRGLTELAIDTERNAALFGIGAELSGIADELRIANTPSPVRTGLLTTTQRVALANAKSHLNEALLDAQSGNPDESIIAITRAITSIDVI